MKISTRIDPIARDIALLIDDDLSSEAQSRMLAEFAGAEIAEAERTNRLALGGAVDKEVFVDGRKDAALESVRQDGVIVAEFDLVHDVVEWIGQQLVLTSPRLSGRYAQSHVLFADGQEVELTGRVPVAAEYVFLNVQPYARKIERGLSSQAPDGVYQSLAAVAGRRFGNVAAIKFTYRSVQSGKMVDYVAAGLRARAVRRADGRFSGSVSGRSKAGLAASKREHETRLPAILVRLY